MIEHKMIFAFAKGDCRVDTCRATKRCEKISLVQAKDETEFVGKTIIAKKKSHRKKNQNNEGYMPGCSLMSEETETNMS